MSLIPHRFLIRPLYQAPFVAELPGEDDRIVELPAAARIDNLAAIDGAKRFADVRIGWNEQGLGIVVEVKGKENYPLGEADKPRQSDGATIWIDTRGDRTSHRALRTCHQFHLVAAGGGEAKDEPYFSQTKIHRATADAPIADDSEIPFRFTRIKGGYRVEAFLPAAALAGYDPEQYPRLGIFYSIRDHELGEDTLGMDGNFPYWEDPSLWATLEMVK